MLLPASLAKGRTVQLPRRHVHTSIWLSSRDAQAVSSEELSELSLPPPSPLTFPSLTAAGRCLLSFEILCRQINCELSSFPALCLPPWAPPGPDLLSFGGFLL